MLSNSEKLTIGLCYREQGHRVSADAMNLHAWWLLRAALGYVKGDIDASRIIRRAMRSVPNPKDVYDTTTA